MVRSACLALITACLLLLTSHSMAAVSAQLSAQNIDELETVRLLIKITETRQTQTLDLSVLEKDFHIMNTNTVSQSRYLNGRGQTWVDYQITLQPKRTGTLQIPSITVGQEQTPTLELNVRPLSTTTRALIDELVFFENEVSSETVYVQSQLILTRRLLYSQGVQLYSDLPGAPELNDAVVLTLGETVSGTIQRNGKTYGVVQQRYAIFPETSGSFTLPGISITASVRLIENDRASRKGVRVGTENVVITVLPVPAEYPSDQPWLPAEKVTLFNVISPDRQTHQVGDTLTHELLIHMEGNIGTISPPIGLPLDDQNFRVYPQAPVIEDDTSGNIVKGSRLQTNSIVPLRPGPITLPISQLTWWDTVNQQVRISRSQPISLSVEGTAITQAAPDATPAVVDTATQENGGPASTPAFEIRSLAPVLYTLGIVVLAGLVLWLLRRAWRLVPRKQHEPNVRAELTRAFGSGDAELLHRVLGDFLCHHYQCPRHLAMSHFVNQNAEIAQAVDHLNRHLYGGRDHAQAVAGSPAGQTLSESIRVIRQACDNLPRSTKTTKDDAVLPDLYPA
jgi:oxygen tolerance protein BatD